MLKGNPYIYNPVSWNITVTTEIFQNKNAKSSLLHINKFKMKLFHGNETLCFKMLTNLHLLYQTVIKIR